MRVMLDRLDKDFKKDFEALCNKISSNENFAFVRFSDGEADILKNIRLILADDYVIEGNVKHDFGYSKEDHKHFDPEKHGFVREKLMESFLFSKENYYTGIACPCCIGGKNAHVWMKKLVKRTNENLTWANLLVNGNYKMFIEKMIPILSKRKIVLVCSKNADIEKTRKELNFDIVKDFRVGENCIVNDHHLIEDIKKWIRENDIENHVFLFSASSLSEILIYELFKDYGNNTYLDIGTTLHPFFGLKLERDYLKGYFSESYNSQDINKACEWSNDIYFVNCEDYPQYWNNIMDLREKLELKTEKDRNEYMMENAKNFAVVLIDNEFAGYGGLFGREITIAVDPRFQGQGVGKYLFDNLLKLCESVI